MKKSIILILLISFTIFLTSCIGFRTNFKFPNEYGESQWVSKDNNFDILIFVDANNESYSSITYDEITKNYKVLFAVDGVSFRCLNENSEYVLEDGTTISQEQYESDFQSATSNVMSSSFVITKAKDEMMECYVTAKELNYIFPNYCNKSENEKLYFNFKMVAE